MRNLYSDATVAKATSEMLAAWNGNDEQAIEAASTKWSEAIYERMATEFKDIADDERALAMRGYRQLTSEETKFYNAFIEKAKAPQAAYSDALSGLPATIIEDVYRHLEQEHPILNAINFVNTGYSTKLIMNDHTATNAAWGAVTAAVSQEIASSFRVVDMTIAKLSCYALLPLDMIRLGVTFIDNYVRTVITEAMALALEAAIVTGDGNSKPIGMTRKLDDEAVISSNVYEAKTAVSVTDFTPETYGELIADNLLQADNGVYKSKINNLGIICNPVDYYKKVMPATTVLNTAGQYVGGLFPVPTAVYACSALEEGTAVIGFMDEYTCGIGAPKTGSIDFSDEFKFLDDVRTFKTITYGMGRAYDNSSFAVLDISSLDPAYVNVKTITSA